MTRPSTLLAEACIHSNQGSGSLTIAELSLARDRDARSQWLIDGVTVNKHLTCGLQLFLLLLVCLTAVRNASGQASTSQILNQVMGTGRTPSSGTSAASGNSDPLGRSTPRGAVFGFLQSAQLGKYDTAAQYLQLNAQRRNEGQQLAEQLLVVINHGFTGNVNGITDQPAGTEQIGVPTGHEQVGMLGLSETEVPLDLVHVTDADGNRIWLISSDTLSKLPELYSQTKIQQLIGGIAVLSDEVIRVGDVCRFGDKSGVVEDISLRSTRIRTAERTELSIPNGMLATMSVENLTRRDKMLFEAKPGLRYETTPDQLRAVLAEIRRMLYEHPKVEQEPAGIRFSSFEDHALRVELSCYLLTTNDTEYLAIREDLLLRTLEIVKAAGTGFALPSRTIYLTGDPGLDPRKTAETEQKVNRWREHHELPFPDFDPNEIPALRDKIVYPVPESAVRNEDKEPGTE